MDWICFNEDLKLQCEMSSSWCQWTGSIVSSPFRVICMCVNVSTNNLTNHEGYSLHLHRPASKYPNRKMLKKILIKVLIALIFLPYILFPLCCQHIDINPCHGHLFMRERERERERESIRTPWGPYGVLSTVLCRLAAVSSICFWNPINKSFPKHCGWNDNWKFVWRAFLQQ